MNASTRMIFVNLPVAELARSVAFYEAMGATRNPHFSDESAACMVLSEAIYVMLLTHPRFSQFTPRPVADARATSQVLLALSQENRAAVDAVIDRAVAAGGMADPAPKEDFGFMYSRSLEDPDGHIWESVWMDPEAAAQGTGQAGQVGAEGAASAATSGDGNGKPSGYDAAS
ncbi:putative lactoylglutathione lyase [Angulomicrobium amanitiforme]|uniref:Lactoylglutathione lyase n=1 Tax=Ancylobacter amanitiformis TaxID=217069 RepID=A0ABU0LRI3_9HYPH|nr:putative lactoylglutathione lyase [Ancylobacter amanitiformis]